LAEFSISIEVFYGMVICVTDCVRWADVGAGETCNTIFPVFDHADMFFWIKLKDFGRADINAEFASTA